LIENDSDLPLKKKAQLDCLHGRDKLVFWLNETLHSCLGIVVNTIPSCHNVSKYIPERKRLVREFGFWMKHYDVMGGLGIWIEPKKHSLCRPCLKYLEGTYASIRKEAWGKLPSFFGLPDWPALEGGN